MLAIPYDTPFIALTKAAFTHLANEQLEDVTRALEVHGDLLEDLEHDRLDEREISRRVAAFGLDPTRRFAALLAVPHSGGSGDALRLAVAR